VHGAEYFFARSFSFSLLLFLLQMRGSSHDAMLASRSASVLPSVSDKTAKVIRKAVSKLSSPGWKMQMQLSRDNPDALSLSLSLPPSLLFLFLSLFPFLLDAFARKRDIFYRRSMSDFT